MFGLGKKKVEDPDMLAKEKRDQKSKDELEKGLKKEKEREKKRKEKEPSAFAGMMLVVTVLFGLFFWVYGRVSGNMEYRIWDKETSDRVSSKNQKPKSSNDKGSEGIDLNDDGVIIFEKEE